MPNEDVDARIELDMLLEVSFVIQQRLLNRMCRPEVVCSIPNACSLVKNNEPV